MKEFLFVIRNYAKFNGRAGVREYWMFALWVFITSIILDIVLGVGKAVTGESLFSHVSVLYSFFLMIPSMAVCARRLHDINKSGWWQLLPLSVLLVAALFLSVHIWPLGILFVIGATGALGWLVFMLCRKSDVGENRFGLEASPIA